MKLSAPQQIISDHGARFRVISAGRRFGKSYLSINEMAKFARIPNSRVLYVAPTYRQAKNVIWDDLKSKLIDIRWVKKINESELNILLVNGSVISIRSSDNYDSLRGGKYDFIVLDESADIRPEAWFQVLRPTLSDRGGHAMFIGTPKGMGSWFYELWGQSEHLDDWQSFQFTTLEGGNVPEQEITDARRDLDDRTFEQEYMAKFVSYAGVIFHAWSPENIRKHPGLAPTGAIHVGMDFNTSPICAVLAHKSERGLHIFDEIEIYSSNTMEMATEIRNRYPNHQIIVYPDATGSRTNTNSQGVSDHIILQNNGFKVVTGKVNPNVNDSIVSVNSLMCNGSHIRNLLVDPKCRKAIDCILKYTYKEGTRIPNKDNVNDHFADAIRYVSHGIFPYQKTPQSGHKNYRKF